MKRFMQGLLGLCAAAALSAGAHAQVANPEVEGNESKATATIAASGGGGMVPNDFLIGTSTGTATTPVGAINTIDYYRVRIAPSPPGKYCYRLILSSQVAGHTLRIRGLSQAGGVINTTSDVSFQTHYIPAGSTDRIIQWYGFGYGHELYVSVSGVAATTAQYTVRLMCTPVTPIVIPGPILPGTITIARAAGNTADTDVWVYDSNFLAIPGYGNDTPNALTRPYTDGTFYIAYGNFNTANNLASPSDDGFVSGNVLDFPNAVACSIATLIPNMNVQLTHSGGVTGAAGAKANPLDIVWYCFAVMDVPRGACCTNNGCVFVTQQVCQAQGGQYLGDGTACGPMGACCTQNGCIVTSRECCLLAGGQYQGDGTECCVAAGVPISVTAAPNLPIPDNNPAGISHTLTFPTHCKIYDVNIKVRIPDHTFIGDLRISVTHNGTTVNLWTNQCGGNDGMDVQFDDEGVPVMCATPTLGTFMPASALSAFDGGDAFGPWVITVADTAGTDVGTLAVWEVTVTCCRNICPPVILGFDPPSGGIGDIVTIVGSGFGNNPDNICCVIGNPDGEVIPMRAISANDTSMQVRLAAVRPDATPGPIMVGVGEGSMGRFMPAFFDIFVEDDVWTWCGREALGGMGGSSQQPFVPNPTPPPPPPPPNEPSTAYVFGQLNAAGELCIFVDGSWMDNTYIRVIVHIFSQGGARDDLDLGCIRIRLGGNAFECARRICDMIRCAIQQRLPGVFVNCDVIQVGPNTAKIILRAKNTAGQFDPITIGGLDLCITMPRKRYLPSGLPVTPFFAADITATANGGVRAFNIGSSGQDGVTINTLEAQHGVMIDTELISLDLAGAEFSLRAWGKFNGLDHSRLGTARVHHASDSFFDVFADFSDIGSPTARVQVLNNGVMVGEVVVPTGMLGTMQDSPTSPLRITGCGKLPPNPPCFILDLEFPVLFRATGSTVNLMGDELRILAHQAGGPVSSIQAMDLFAADPVGPVGEFTIVNATLLPPPTTCGDADFDNDGDQGTDLDIEAFFACLGGACCTTCDSPDFDGDGDTGTDLDIEAFFRVLGGGIC